MSIVLVAHIDELRVLLCNHMVGILAINESKLDSTINSKEIYTAGHEIVRRDRPQNGRQGGGICIYIKSNLSFRSRDDLYLMKILNS